MDRFWVETMTLGRSFFALLILSAVTAKSLVSQEASSRGATVSGVVYDSVGKGPLAAALVQLVVQDAPHLPRSAKTDVAGRFRIEDVPAGTWHIGFYHVALDSLGLASPVLKLEIRDSTAVRAMLAVPAPRTIVRATCGAKADSGGLWIGETRAAGSGHMVPNAKVLAQWTTLIVQGNSVVRHAPSVSMESSTEGRFGVCGIPPGEMIFARSWQSEDSTGVITMTLPDDGLLKRDLFLPVDPASGDSRVIVTGDDSIPPVRRGRGRVSGVVRKVNGTPLANARLTFWETGDEVTTGSSGHYQIDSLPSGSATLEARALGYLPLTRTVDVHPSAAAVADFTMELRSVYLDTVRVVGTRVYDSPEYRGFLERKKRGFGYFMDEEYIERRNAIYVSDLFRMIPGVRITSGFGGGQVFLRGGCSPTVFVNGMRMAKLDGFGLEDFVSASEVRALEVYTRGSGVPLEFTTIDGCGAVVFWTGGRTPKIEK